MVKIAVLALALGAILIYLKSIKSEIFFLALIGASIVILYAAGEYFLTTIEFFAAVVQITGVKSEYFSIVFKCVAIGYLTEFSAGTLSDAGLTSLADKLVFVGKIVIFCVSLPIVYAVFNLITGLMQ